MGSRQRLRNSLRKPAQKPAEATTTTTTTAWQPLPTATTRFGVITVAKGEKLGDVLLRILEWNSQATIGELTAALVGLKPIWTSELLAYRLNQMVRDKLLTTDYVNTSGGGKQAVWSKAASYGSWRRY